MYVPLSSQQCFFTLMIVFVVVGFMRGWKRELVSLVFVLLGVYLVHPDTSDVVNCFLGRSGNYISYVSWSSAPPTNSCTPPVSFLSGPFWSLVIFLLIVALGFIIGNRAFCEPDCLLTRVLGIFPAILSGSFILFYLSIYMQTTPIPSPPPPVNPASFLPFICVVIVITLIVTLIAACCKR